MLKGNIVGIPVLDFSAPLESDQLAPFGFLIVQRALATFVGDAELRPALPAAGGRDRGAVRSSRCLAPRVLPRRAALVALVLFALLGRPDLLLQRDEALLPGYGLRGDDHAGRVHVPSGERRPGVGGLARRPRRVGPLVLLPLGLRRGGLRDRADPRRAAGSVACGARADLDRRSAWAGWRISWSAYQASQAMLSPDTAHVSHSGISPSCTSSIR